MDPQKKQKTSCSRKKMFDMQNLWLSGTVDVV